MKKNEHGYLCAVYPDKFIIEGAVSEDITVTAE